MNAPKRFRYVWHVSIPDEVFRAGLSFFTASLILEDMGYLEV